MSYQFYEKPFICVQINELRLVVKCYKKCADREWSLEDQPEVMDDRVEGEGKSGKSVLEAWHDDDDNNA